MFVITSQKESNYKYHLIPFNIHVNVAATGDAELSPTPAPFNIAWVVNVPVI